MKLQVLVSTMNQEDYSLLDKMNIQTDSIIINQGDRNTIEEFKYRNKYIKFMSFSERGIGLSRNTALMRASGDYCLFADDDVTYVDNYEKIILSAFENQPDADIIIFNVPSTNSERQSYQIKERSRVRWFNSLKYGAVRIVIKTHSIKKENIYFSMLFGGGAKYGSGEDSLFIFEAIKKGLKIYANPSIIGYVSQENSTWFEGYNDKFFLDKGALYSHISRRWAKILVLQFIIRHRKLFGDKNNLFKMYRLMLNGIKEAR